MAPVVRSAGGTWAVPPPARAARGGGKSMSERTYAPRSGGRSAEPREGGNLRRDARGGRRDAAEAGDTRRSGIRREQGGRQSDESVRATGRGGDTPESRGSGVRNGRATDRARGTDRGTD